MRRSLLAALLLALPATTLAADVHRLAWEVSVAGKSVGTREATITVERDGLQTSRMIEAFTTLAVTVGPQEVSWRQRLTGFAERTPMSFHSVLDEDGFAREVQGRWSGSGWTVTVVDGRDVRSYDAPASRIDLSTADLMDPLSRYHLGRFDSARILSTETGDVWEGPVTRLGPDSVRIDGERVDVQGYAWKAPEGTQKFWYTSDGWLVRFETRVLGVKVEGLLTSPPPKGPDAFAVRTGSAKVEVSDL